MVFENHNWSELKGNAQAAYLNSLLSRGAHAEQYFNPPGLHPSLPNYIWLEAGSNLGITDDDTPVAFQQNTTQHLATLLNTAGISWKAYEEDILGTDCPITDEGNNYTTHHDPFVYFNDVTSNMKATSAYCISHIRPYTELAGNLQNNTQARYNFITPNL